MSAAAIYARSYWTTGGVVHDDPDCHVLERAKEYWVADYVAVRDKPLCKICEKRNERAEREAA